MWRGRATWKKFSLAAAALIQKLSKPADASSIARGDGGKQLKGRRCRQKTKLKKEVLCPKSERAREILLYLGEPTFFEKGSTRTPPSPPCRRSLILMCLPLCQTSDRQVKYRREGRERECKSGVLGHVVGICQRDHSLWITSVHLRKGLPIQQLQAALC